MILSIIVPVFNEKNTIEQVIKRINSIPLSFEKEIIVVDDGSSDGTLEILKRIKKEHNFSLLEHRENRGKGAAIRTAIPLITGDMVIIQDADLELNPKDYPALTKPILEGKADVVYGSRILNKEEKNAKKKWSFFLGGKLLTFLANFLYGANITDESIGYKVFRAGILKNIDLEYDRFEFCPEITAKVAKKGIKIYEVPVSYNPRTKKEGKKIKARDGLKAIWVLIKYRFK